MLGTAQDGGLPQIACPCTNCAPAWTNPSLRRSVVCLGLVARPACRSWLMDASPDFREQLHFLQSLAPECSLAGIVLTHAHTGHYSGLIHLGREAWNTSAMSVYASPRMSDFLARNAPWSQLVSDGSIQLHAFSPTAQVELSPALKILPYPVPHRDEYSDTLAFVVQGPSRKLFYCPDIDDWGLLKMDLRQLVAQMDVALLDGTFFSAAELLDREVADIPHPLVTDTAARLRDVECDVRLVHLNHTNPLHRPGSQRTWLAAQGIRVGALGDCWIL